MTDRSVEVCVGPGGRLTAGDVVFTATSLYNLGAPVVADVDRIVVSANMKVGTYTIAAQPDVPRNITVKRTAVSTADTGGTIAIVGRDSDGKVITETISVGSDGVTVAGTKAFDSVASVTGAGWVTASTADTIEIGVGTELGLPVAVSAAAKMVLGILDTTITAHNATVSTPPSVAGTTVDMSAGTYDGSKNALVFVVGQLGFGR